MTFPRVALRVLVPPLVLAAAVAAAPRHRPSGRPAMRVLCLGDSYTIGEGVPASGRWPEQLVARWRARAMAVDSPVVIARTGWTTDELFAAVDRAPLHGTFDWVTLQIGVNNQYRGLPLDQFRTEFAVLLSRALDSAGGQARHVVVLSIPDWGVTPYAAGRDRERIAAEIDAYNDAARERAGRLGARWVDVTGLSRAHGADARFLAADGLHPSAAAYAEWARALDDSLYPTSPPAHRERGAASGRSQPPH